jgi:nicotinamide-nucleotide amidase
MNELVQAIAARLAAHGAMLATAESCTGGWAAQALTALAGSSNWFERGFVTYSNGAKQEMLGVRAETLARHGAVSEETAREMALGAIAHSGASVGLAITGIAGPGGGTREKPVGTVCFAWALKGAAARSETRHFSGDREAVRRQSVERALAGVLELLDAAPRRA